MGQTEFNYIETMKSKSILVRGKTEAFFAYLANISTFVPPIQYYYIYI